MQADIRLAASNSKKSAVLASGGHPSSQMQGMAASVDHTAAAYQRVNDWLAPEATPAKSIGYGRRAAPPHGCFEPFLPNVALSVNVRSAEGLSISRRLRAVDEALHRKHLPPSAVVLSAQIDNRPVSLPGHWQHEESPTTPHLRHQQTQGYG